MRNGDAELDAIIARIRAIPGVAKRAAPAAAVEVKAELERQINAGTTAEGKAWEPRKADGGKPLEGAEKALYVAAVGSTVVCRLTGHVARHHRGRARGGVVRSLLPVKGLTPGLTRAIKRALTEEFESSVKGAP